MDQLQSMRVFAKVADLGSFARAAASLELSNAVVTRHVADLENKLCTRLMNRTTRSLSLTEAGTIYLESVRKVLNALEDADQQINKYTQDPIGKLRIVSPVIFGARYFGPAIQAYTQHYKFVIPEITLIDRQIDLVEEGFDIGIVFGTSICSANVVSRRLTHSQLILCASPHYFLNKEALKTPETLVDYSCMALSHGSFNGEYTFRNNVDEIKVRPPSVITTNSGELLKDLAIQGMGIVALPNFIISEDLAKGKLIEVLPEYELPLLEISIIYPSKDHMPAKIRTFIDYLVEYFAKGVEKTSM